MNALPSLRTVALASAVALACAAPMAMAAKGARALAADSINLTPSKSAPSQPVPPAPDPAVDAEGAWTHFLAHGDFDTAWNAYDVLSKLGYSYAAVDAKACHKDAAALQESLRKAPVALALHRAAMLCAEAAGDEAAAEHEMLVFAGLARLALRDASDAANAAPIRVLRQQDAYALIKALGMKSQYEWFDRTQAARTYPIAIAVWDPDHKVERVLRFDWIDVAQRITRDAAKQYPFHRDEVAEAQIRANARANDPASVDQLAWRDARESETPRAAIDHLRMGVGAGGVQSAHAWLGFCSEAKAPADCGDGFVDAVLPLAEKKHALPLVLLAYAYGEGVGVPRDAAVADQLLDAADHRWSHHGGSVRYADMWLDFHADTPLPERLLPRLSRAAADGNADAQLLLFTQRMRRDPKTRPTDAEIALLSSRAMNGAGQGYGVLAAVARERKQDDDTERYERLAATAGNPDMQGRRAWRLLYGDGKRDAEAGRRWLVDAAQGGDAWAARNLAGKAWDDGDALAAERWLLQAVRNGDVDSILFLADIYASETRGTTGDAKRAAEIYRHMSPHSAEARRRLAGLAAAGKGMAKDVPMARRLLLQDAEQGDHDSEADLGFLLLRGDLPGEGGPEADERDGVRWVERAIAGGDTGAASNYGYWLYYRKGTDASRTQAIDLWRKALARGDDGVENNLAWVLCTTPFDALRNPKEGLAIVDKMGSMVDMPTAWLDTVAACHAANGDFTQAQRAQREAIARLDDDTDVEEAGGYRERLALYADGKPYRDPPERRE